MTSGANPRPARIIWQARPRTADGAKPFAGAPRRAIELAPKLHGGRRARRTQHRFVQHSPTCSRNSCQAHATGGTDRVISGPSRDQDTSTRTRRKRGNRQNRQNEFCQFCRRRAQGPRGQRATHPARAPGISPAAGWRPQSPRFGTLCRRHRSPPVCRTSPVTRRARSSRDRVAGGASAADRWALRGRCQGWPQARNDRQVRRARAVVTAGVSRSARADIAPL